MDNELSLADTDYNVPMLTEVIDFDVDDMTLLDGAQLRDYLRISPDATQINTHVDNTFHAIDADIPVLNQTVDNLMPDPAATRGDFGSVSLMGNGSNLGATLGAGIGAAGLGFAANKALAEDHHEATLQNNLTAPHFDTGALQTLQLNQNPATVDRLALQNEMINHLRTEWMPHVQAECEKVLHGLVPDIATNLSHHLNAEFEQRLLQWLDQYYQTH